MSGGRTTWFARDAAFHRRELVVELGAEHGPAALAVLDVLSAWAQEQRAAGQVKGGFRGLAREAFIDPDVARAVVATAVQIGLLDDFAPQGDERRFVCRVSGWQSDQTKAKAANRQARARESGDENEGGNGLENAPLQGVTRRDEGVMHRDGSSPTRHDQTRHTSSLRSDVAREARANPPDDEWPARLPDDLHPLAGHVHERLAALSSERGGDTPTRRRVGEVVADFPDHDHRSVVGDVFDYWVHGKGSRTERKDWVRVYRDRCKHVTAPALRGAPVVGFAPANPTVEQIEAARERVRRRSAGGTA